MILMVYSIIQPVHNKREPLRANKSSSRSLSKKHGGAIYDLGIVIDIRTFSAAFLCKVDATDDFLDRRCECRHRAFPVVILGASTNASQRDSGIVEDDSNVLVALAKNFSLCLEVVQFIRAAQDLELHVGSEGRDPDKKKEFNDQDVIVPPEAFAYLDEM
jgi:hypothetical protein